MKKLLEENSIKVIELQILEKSENSKMNIKEKVTDLKRKYTQNFKDDLIDDENKLNNNLQNSKKKKLKNQLFENVETSTLIKKL